MGTSKKKNSSKKLQLKKRTVRDLPAASKKAGRVKGGGPQPSLLCSGTC